MMLLRVFITALAAISVYLALAFVRRYIRQRPLRKIPGPPSTSFTTGNMRQWFGHGALPFQEQTMERYGKVIRLNGFWGNQMLVIADTKAIYNIFLKSRDIFEVSENRTVSVRMMFGPGLFATVGDTHRKQRKLMNPAFSVNHMRRILPVFHSLTSQLVGIMRKEVEQELQEVDMTVYLGRLALELISQAGLGYSFGALEGKDKDNEYGIALKQFMPAESKMRMWRLVVPALTRLVPGSILRGSLKFIPWKNLHDLVDLLNIMHRASTNIWEGKKRLYALGDKSVVNEYGEGKDLMSILLKANTTAEEQERLTDEELLAQINSFLFAGSDTTLNTLCRIFLILAQQPDAQERLRKELTDASSEKEKVSYDELSSLPYLEAVCRETLRLFPPVQFSQRDAGADVVLPLMNPILDVHGKPVTELFVPKGTIVYVNIPGVNRDKDIWGSDALEWKPERWLAPLPASVGEARIPGVYLNTLTFAGGNRSCIGFKFAQLEIKAVLAQLIPAFRFSPSEKHEIVWRFGAIVTPSIKGSTTNDVQMPMRVSPIL